MTALAVVSHTVMSLATGAGRPVHRVRTVLLDPASGTLSVDEHVRVGWPARRRWSVCGDVLVGHGAGAWWATRLAASCPGALVVAVHDGPRCWLRLGPGGSVLEFEARGPGRPDEVWDRLASLAHSCLVAGLPAPALGSAVAGLLRTQDPGSARSSSRSRCRAASASSDCGRPTEE